MEHTFLFLCMPCDFLLKTRHLHLISLPFSQGLFCFSDYCSLSLCQGSGVNFRSSQVFSESAPFSGHAQALSDSPPNTQLLLIVPVFNVFFPKGEKEKYEGGFSPLNLLEVGEACLDVGRETTNTTLIFAPLRSEVAISDQKHIFTIGSPGSACPGSHKLWTDGSRNTHIAPCRRAWQGSCCAKSWNWLTLIPKHCPNLPLGVASLP